MRNYSIVRIGKEYVVRAGEKSVLKVASRRSAVRLVIDAAELLDSHTPTRPSAQTHGGPALTRDPSEVP